MVDTTDPIVDQLNNEFGLKEKLKLLSGDSLPYPEVGELLTVRSLVDLQKAKTGKGLAPLTVTPIIADKDKQRYKEWYDMEEGIEYKLFIPTVGRNLLSAYLRDVNKSLENCLITMEIKEWKTDREDVNRDRSGKAQSVVIIRAEKAPDPVSNA